MKPIGFYKTTEQIRQAFKDACKRNGWAETEDNFNAYMNGLRIMHFTEL